MINIFNNYNYINIFTDGSLYKNNNTGETISCPGSVIVTKDFISSRNIIMRNSTNNEAEVMAIQLGIDDAIQYIKETNTSPIFNIFSDSKISVYGLREWIFNWYKYCNDSIMYSSSGKPVANQEIYKAIVLKLIANNLRINLYHQKGHVNINLDHSIENALRVFNISNSTRINDLEFIKQISIYNNKVDIDTKLRIDEYVSNNDLSVVPDKYYNPMIIDIENTKLIKQYRNLINYK